MDEKKDSSLVKITDSSFKNDVIDHKGLALVDFWAEWCGPCRQLMPVLQAFSEENPTVKVCKMNVDENQQIPGEMGIRGIPTLILFKDGEKVGTKVGSLSQKALETWVQEHA